VDGAELVRRLESAARTSLADYKVPDRIVVEESLPLTPMMKVDKRSLADRAASLPPVPRARGATREPAQHR